METIELRGRLVQLLAALWFFGTATAGGVLNASGLETRLSPNRPQDPTCSSWDELQSLNPSDEYTAALAEYRKKRAELPDTVEGHFALARWCRPRGLQQQERAHYFRVLQLDPDHGQARRRLGFRRHNGVWIEHEAMQQALKDAKQGVKDLRKWRPRLTKIRTAWLRKPANERDTLRRELEAIDEPEATMAIETVLCPWGDELALIGVDVLEAMPAYQAAAALTRIAVFAPVAGTREAAAVALRSRRKHEYVPLLLASMQTPVRTISEVRGNGSALNYREVYVTESQYQQQRLVVDTQHRYRMRGTSPGMARALPAIAQNDAHRRFGNLSSLVNHHNTQLSIWNARLCRALTTATEQQQPWVPAAWWEWWNDENEVYIGDEKPVNTAYVSRQATRVVTPPPVRRSDCLAGDTLVWTESGCVPIREVKIGDLVAACDIDTGELALKPVIRVTHRPPEELLRLHVGTEVLEASGGHPFWVDGVGWQKARNLTNSLPLHSPEGNRSLDDVQPGRTQASLNLVVADFHNFFVGNSRLLTHDNTVRLPTNVSAPGRRK